MLKWPRVSLLTLLLVVTLAAVAVSHWRTSLELENQRSRVAELQQQVRIRNDRLGILTVDDRSQVHVILTDTRYGSVENKKVGPRAFSWHVYLPPSRNWELCWAFGAFEGMGEVPRDATHDSRVLDIDDGPDTLAIDFEQAPTGSWRMKCKYDQSEWSAAIPDERASWLNHESVYASIAAGDDRRAGPLTESFDPNEPVLLLDQWHQDLNPSAGVVVWLQPRIED